MSVASVDRSTSYDTTRTAAFFYNNEKFFSVIFAYLFSHGETFDF